MQDANKFNDELLKGLVIEIHKGNTFVLAELDKKFEYLDTKIDKLDARLSTRIDDLDVRLSTRVNELETKLTNQIDRVGRELTVFRKDATGQLRETRSPLLRIDEKLQDHEERLLKLESN